MDQCYASFIEITGAHLNPYLKPFAASGRAGALIVGATCCASAGADPDLWGHLTFGRDILQIHGLTSIDPYSFTQDIPWVNHEWLSEVLFAAAYGASGVLGLVILKTVILALTLAVVWSVLRRINPSTVRWWLMAVVGICMAPAALTFRPQLWTLLACAVLVLVLTRPRLRWWAVPLFALWANLHGGWIVGVGVAGAWLIGRLIDTGSWRNVLTDGAILGLSALATVANPYGVGLWRFIAETVRMTRAITEWRPIWDQAALSWAVLWILLVGVNAAMLRNRRNVIAWATVLPVIALGCGGLFVSRLGPLFAIVSTLLWRGSGATSPDAALTTASPIRRPSFWIIDVTGAVAVWLITAALTTRCLAISGEWAPDLLAAGALDGASAGRLVLPADWGQYAIWHWGPRLRVSSDGRRETVYSQRMIDLDAQVSAGASEGVAYVLSQRPEYVWLKQTAGTMRSELAADGYRIDVSTARSFIAVREDLPRLTVTPPRNCFP